MKQIIIFGTGKIAEQHFKMINTEHGSDIIFCFLDSMLSKDTFCGRPVKHPSELKKIDVNEYIYYLGTLTSKKSMLNELLQLGVKKDNIVVEKDFGSNSFEENVKKVSSILLYPKVDDLEILRKLENEFIYLVPNMVQLSEKPSIIVEHNVCSLSSEIFHSISEYKLNEYDLVLVWKKEALNNSELEKAEQVYCIDPSYFRMINIRILMRLNQLLMDEEAREKMYFSSKTNFYKMNSFQSNGEAYVFGSGPSSKKVVDYKFSKSAFRIVCNSYINSTELMNIIDPNVYVIAEEEYATFKYKEMLERIIDYTNQNNCFLIMPEVLGAVFIKRYPNCSANLITLSFSNSGIHFPAADDLSFYRKAYNVMTAIAIPIASSLCNTIYIFGCDGVSLDKCKDGDLWRHNTDFIKNETQGQEKKIIEENWSMEYYLKHISYFEELLAYGEKVGKFYISKSFSYIPALTLRVV